MGFSIGEISAHQHDSDDSRGPAQPPADRQRTTAPPATEGHCRSAVVSATATPGRGNRRRDDAAAEEAAAAGETSAAQTQPFTPRPPASPDKRPAAVAAKPAGPSSWGLLHVPSDVQKFAQMIGQLVGTISPRC